MRFIKVGFNNLVNRDRVVGVKRMTSYITWRLFLQKMEDNGLLIDMTYGRLTSTVIKMDSGHYVLSAHPPEVILERINDVG